MSCHTLLQFASNAPAFIRIFQGGNSLTGIFLCFAFAAAAGPALAADLPSKTASPVFLPPTPAEFSWTGFYVGVHVGAGTDHFAFKYGTSVPVPGGTLQGTNGITAGGPIGGIQAGFNYELPFFHIVAGVEVDNSVSGIRGQTTVYGTLNSGAPVTVTFGSKYLDFGTARFRIGYAWGRFLPYFTAGFSYGTIETYYNFATPGFFNAGASTATRSGVFPHVGALGIGVEYAFAPNFTVKAEYLYDFINARPVIVIPGDGTTISFGTRTMYHIGRVGLNYKFDWLSPPASPVVAKY